MLEMHLPVSVCLRVIADSRPASGKGSKKDKESKISLSPEEIAKLDRAKAGLDMLAALESHEGCTTSAIALVHNALFVECSSESGGLDRAALAIVETHASSAFVAHAAKLVAPSKSIEVAKKMKQIFLFLVLEEGFFFVLLQHNFLLCFFFEKNKEEEERTGNFRAPESAFR